MKYKAELVKEDLTEWLLSPLVSDSVPDVLINQPGVFVSLFNETTDWSHKAALFMGLPLEIQQKYLAQHMISLDDCVHIFATVDVILDDFVDIILGLDLDKRLYIFMRYHAYRLSSSNDLFLAIYKGPDFPELFTDSREAFQEQLVLLTRKWLTSYDQSIDSIFPLYCLAILDSDDPCVVLESVLEQLESAIHAESVISSKHELIYYIKLSYLLVSMPSDSDRVDLLRQRVASIFYDRLSMIKESSLLTILLQLPMLMIQSIVQLTFEKRVSQDDVAERFWKQLQSISDTQCVTLSLVLQSDSRYVIGD